MAIVTGAASGMGLECAIQLLADGLSVALIDVNASALSALRAGRLAEYEDRIRVFPSDVTNAEQVSDTVASVVAELGALTVLSNAAGVLRSTRLESISEDEWDFMMDVSVKGAFLMSQVVAPHLRSSGAGRIVNFSSTAGKTVSTLGGAHCTAAKSALLGLTRAMAKELATDGVTVNAVCPGLIDTEMVRATIPAAKRHEYAQSFPLGRLGTASEVAALVGFLCSGEAAYITGASLDINGGDLMV